MFEIGNEQFNEMLFHSKKKKTLKLILTTSVVQTYIYRYVHKIFLYVYIFIFYDSLHALSSCIHQHY